MLKHILTLAAGLVFTLAATAIPAKRITRTVTQPDGTQVTVMLTGDESFHCYRTLDGQPLVQRADGGYCYATLSGTLLRASSVLAHDAAGRSGEERTFVQSLQQQNEQLATLQRRRMAARNASRKRRLPAVRKANATQEVQHRKGLVILVNFQDKKMYKDNTRQAFDDMMNKVGYKDNGNAGSVHDYFLAQSYGKFDLEFDVVGPVTVSKKLADYGANVGGDDKDPAGMVYEACKLADSQVNFKDYDWDGDGEVDQVFVICAGQSEAAGGAADCIWPHEWNLYSGGYTLTLDGVRIDTYGCSTELAESSTRMDGIGTACHEFSHCMGLPDMYDVDYSGGFGMGDWSIMDSGSYNGDGYAPSGYTAYERWTSGWLQPVELKKACTVGQMPSLDKEPVAYVMYNDANRNEYFLIENRQQDGWFGEDAAKGLLITHVDFDEDAWLENSVNDLPGHQRCTIVPADNRDTEGTTYGDLYPYGGNNQFTNTSSPAASLFNANTDGSKLLSKPLTAMAYDANGLASFVFMGGLSLDVPVADAGKTETTANGFSVSWSPVENAETYSVELRPDQGGSQAASELCQEDFSTWGATLTQDSNADVSSKLDSHMQTPGWTGKKLFIGPARLKMGSSSATGSLLSPLFEAPTSGQASVAFTASPYGRDANVKVKVELCNAYGTVLQSQSFDPTGKEQVAVFEQVDNEFRVNITTSTKRTYLTGALTVYDGQPAEASAHALAATADEPEASTTRLVKGLTECAYTFTSLPTNAAYKWRVRAEAGSVVSAWSAWQQVVLGSLEGIRPARPALVGENQWSAATVVDVYSLSGRRLRSAAFASWQHGLPAGTYLLRAAGRTVVCVK